MGQRNATPGSRALAKLIDEYGEALIPELREYYGIDLRDLFSEDRPLSPRWVLLHANALPLGSASVAAKRGGPEFRGWDEGRYMMASLINAVRLNTHTFVLAHIDPKKTHPELPKMYPLPDDIKERTKPAPKPGSFAAIALAKLSAVKKRKKAQV